MFFIACGLGAVALSVIFWSVGWSTGFRTGFEMGKANVLDRLEESTGRAVEEGEFPQELETHTNTIP
jgi:hypothetical protein